MTTLARYDAACAALAAAVSADEVMRVHVTAAGIEMVAKMAGDFENELRAAKLRTSAAARLGDMIAEAEENGVVAKHGGKRRQRQDDQDRARELETKPATLKEIGVSNRLSARARQLSGIGAQAVAAMLDRMERESRKRGVVAHNVIHQTLGKRNSESRRQLARELSDCSALQPTGRKFAALYADPPWRRKAGIGNRAYENQYPTMTWEDLLAMPVKDRLLPDAQGYIWIPRAHLLALIEVETDTSLGRAKFKMPLAWALAQAWGFDSYSTCAVWTKTDEEMPDDHGLGLVFWDQDELLLVFKRGRGLPKPDDDKKYGSNHRERAERHSAKPKFYRQMINDMTGSVPVLELFAREDADDPLPSNFFTWGNESNNSAEAPEPIDAAGEPVQHDESGEVIDVAPARIERTTRNAEGGYDILFSECTQPCCKAFRAVKLSNGTTSLVELSEPPKPAPEIEIPEFLSRKPPVVSPRIAQSAGAGREHG